jgi:hypothetical protein
VEPYAAVVGVTCGSEVVGVVAAAIGTADGRAPRAAPLRSPPGARRTDGVALTGVEA